MSHALGFEVPPVANVSMQPYSRPHCHAGPDSATETQGRCPYLPSSRLGLGLKSGREFAPGHREPVDKADPRRVPAQP